jgi:hypothetical protein
VSRRRNNTADSVAIENCFDLQPLEKRLFFAAPSAVLTKPIRQELLNHWTGSNKAELQAKLDANKMGAFDGALLSYMSARGGNTFFWNTGDVGDIRTFVNAPNISTSTLISRADNIVAHMFPNGSTSSFDFNMGPGDINWSTAGNNSEFVHVLNRHDFWQDLSQAYVFTQDAKYVNELISQLSSWSLQSPALSDPNAWATDDPPWQPLDVAHRADNWTWAYQHVLGSAGWTADANTLMLYKLYQHGDFLRRVTPYALSSNRALFEAQGLMEVAHLVPEFDNAADWKSYGRNLLFGAMDAQINADGGHAESSPGYAGAVINSLLESYWLDQKKGNASAWPASRITKLENASKAYVELLSPDSKLAALSDSYRQTSDTFWLRSRIILNNTADFPAAKPRLRDVWLFGTTIAGDNITAPVSPAMPSRGNTFSMPNSGYYVMRSGSDSNARQVIFDAGPTGGAHGHYDLLNFELFGYGAPLISDPGLYTYQNSVRRNWAISTPAHNTISVDGANHSALEGVTNPGIQTSGIVNTAGGYQITASHRAYQGLLGSPVVTRSIWFDGTGVMLVVDWGESATPHFYSQSFLLPGTNTTSGAGWVQTNNAGGNVKIQSILQTGQSSAQQLTISGTTKVFTSNDPDAEVSLAATRHHVDQASTTFAGFVSLINAYNGASVPNITANLVGSITASGSFQVQIVRNGVTSETVTFQPPAFDRPGTTFRPAAAYGGANDVAWDTAGRLHMVFNDRNEKNLKYAVREANGVWGIVQTIDDGFEAGGYPSLQIDNNNNPRVAYFDGNGGDLKYASMTGGAWSIELVDSAGSVGLYPSLVMSRGGGAMIGYYKRTTGDLRLAVHVTGGWQITNIDTAGDVGRCASMSLDPNRPTASKIAIAYDDSNTGAKKYAIQDGFGWAITTVDTTTPTGGGYTSLAFEPYTDTDGRYHPTISYYDSSNSALKFARQSGNLSGAWSAQTVISQGAQGMYTSLFYDGGQRPNIFFFKKTNVTAYRAVRNGGTWKFTYLGTGGREAQTSRKSTGEVAVTNLDADGIRIEVLPA